jgi:siroheme synthase
MGVRTLRDVTVALLEAGLDPRTPAAAVAAPAVTVIGDVAAWAVATSPRGEV